MQDTTDITSMKWTRNSILYDTTARLSIPAASMTSTTDANSNTLFHSDHFGRQTTRLPTPPVMYAGSSVDISGSGSSGTPSPKETFKDYFDPCHVGFHSALQKEPLVPKLWGADIHLGGGNDFTHLVGSVLDEEDRPGVLVPGIPAGIACNIASLLSISLATMANMSSDILSSHLRKATGVINCLIEALKATQMDLDEKIHQVWSLQSCLTAKDLEIQNIKQQLTVVNQLYDTQICKFQHTAEKKFPNSSAVSATTSSDQTKIKNPRRRSSGEKTNQSRQQQGLLNVEYRRRLDKNAWVDWEVMVDKIIEQGDQQASLFLQQKLKSATDEQKQGIFEAILPQAYPLMVSRFGNFLVQRLLEVGTPDQVLALITQMQGRVISLSCQQFGCHVLQKAIDCCPDEELKGKLVRELFNGIAETITHKHACHIWQKIFEMQWTMANPPPVMIHVNRALAGQWTKIALDETGSLVIQHIFENCKQEDAGKRLVLTEVLANVVTIAKGQWGNWVIQHILEQAPDSKDREQAFQVVLNHAALLSMDQFGSKVVEKALRTGGPIFLGHFMDKVLETHQRQRREALIDMASDQYGNYVVQWLINHTETKEQVEMCRLIKRHMVSLRGSKYGQRVAFLVDKVLRSHEITTYPVQHH